MTGLIALVIVFLLGVVVGITANGIKINIIHKSVDKPVDNPHAKPVYNSSYGDPEVKQYLDQHYKVGE